MISRNSIWMNLRHIITIRRSKTR